MKTLTTVTWLAEADAICLRLRAEGIEAFIPDQNIVLADPFYSNAIGGVRIQVADSDLPRALEILNQPPASPT